MEARERTLEAMANRAGPEAGSAARPTAPLPTALGIRLHQMVGHLIQQLEHLRAHASPPGSAGHGSNSVWE